LQIFYQEAVTTVVEEYEAFDIFSLVGEMGGALGLFLGWSCLNILLDLIGLLTGYCVESCGSSKSNKRPKKKEQIMAKEEGLY